MDRFEVDGQLIPGICKVPEKFLTPGAHRLAIHRADRPPGPLILDSVGLKLIEVTANRLQLAGPGRALIRFYSPHQPTVRDRGQVVPVQWDKATGIGRIMINRHAVAEELEIQ